MNIRWPKTNFCSLQNRGIFKKLWEPIRNKQDESGVGVKSPIHVLFVKKKKIRKNNPEPLTHWNKLFVQRRGPKWNLMKEWVIEWRKKKTKKHLFFLVIRSETVPPPGFCGMIILVFGSACHPWLTTPWKRNRHLYYKDNRRLSTFISKTMQVAFAEDQEIITAKVNYFYSNDDQIHVRVFQKNCRLV